MTTSGRSDRTPNWAWRISDATGLLDVSATTMSLSHHYTYPGCPPCSSPSSRGAGLAMIDVLARSRSGRGDATPRRRPRRPVRHRRAQARHDGDGRAVLAGLPELPTCATTDIDEAPRSRFRIFRDARGRDAGEGSSTNTAAFDNGLLGRRPSAWAAAATRSARQTGTELARAAARLCPGAWLINFTNPAGIITQAMCPVLVSAPSVSGDNRHLRHRPRQPHTECPGRC